MELATRTLIRDLSAGMATLEQAGGKAASLTSMVAAGLPVPPGFLLTTEAYRQFVAQNGLTPTIEQALGRFTAADPDSWDCVSAEIETAFLAAPIPAEIDGAAREAYAALSEAAGSPGALPVAVRSSATAEDLPGASFAGQQETFLNVVGADHLLESVRRCWASLWTARALAYRHRLGIEQRTVAMAVVVQQLAPAEVAGVMFTANPATGARDELLVNASYGLGEAIVSGQVTPDTFVIDKPSLAVRETVLGAKQLMIVSDAAAGHGTASVPVTEAQQRTPALTLAQLHDLAELGLRVEQRADAIPQDIEWALSDGRFWLLQARPITGLPPATLKDVRWEPPIPGSRWIRRQVVEHMPEPLSPLFEQLYLREGLDRSVDVIMAALNIPDGIDELVQKPLFATVHGFAYQRADIHLTWRSGRMLLSTMARALRSLFQEGVKNWRDIELPAYLQTVARWKPLDPAVLTDQRLMDGVRELAYADARYWFAAALAIGAAKVTDSLLDSYVAKAAPGRHLSSGQFLRALSTRGLASERALDDIADLVRNSEQLRTLVQQTPPGQLCEALAEIPDGQPVLDALDAYFEEFGHLIYSLDFAVPTQVDDPLPVLLTLQALAEQPPRDTDAQLAALARERDLLIRQTDQSFDPFRRRLFRTLLRWARTYSPHREEALFYVGAAWPTLRRLALELGRRLTERGQLTQADDIFYLRPDEIMAASAGGETPAFSVVAQERRQLREARKRLQPPAAVPPAYTFKLGPFDLSSRESQKRNTLDGSTLSGFAVSPGRVTAVASVILSPADFGAMQPGSVLVCPTTTPAWTPLFSQARALVTDIGGILAHGSIVAREYGIPAVMGAGIATQRIRSGQTITVDGDTGTVTLAT